MLEAAADNQSMTKEELMEIADISENSEQVFKVLKEVLRDDIGLQGPVEPAQPATEPLVPASLLQSMMVRENNNIQPQAPASLLQDIMPEEEEIDE